jgi:hypothetical protein
VLQGALLPTIWTGILIIEIKDPQFPNPHIRRWFAWIVILRRIFLKIIYKILFYVSSLLIALALGIAVAALINLFPIIFWGREILIVSPYFTGIPSLILGAIAFKFFTKKISRWFDAEKLDISLIPRTPQFFVALMSLVVSVFVFHVASNGLYPQFLTIVWDEEIQQNNGQVQQIERQYLFERFGLRLSKYDDLISRKATISFEPSKGEARVTLSTMLAPVYLNKIGEIWYLVLAGQSDSLNKTMVEQDWGNHYNTMGQRLAVLKGQTFMSVSWEEAPDEIILNNLIPSRSLQFSLATPGMKRIVSMPEKTGILRGIITNPTGPDALRITRHHAMGKQMILEYKEARRVLMDSK